jgi:hypothetical protein
MGMLISKYRFPGRTIHVVGGIMYFHQCRAVKIHWIFPGGYAVMVLHTRVEQ